MVVQYTESGKRAHFDGLMFCRDDKTGYYLNSTIHKRLHRVVYERFFGDIPKGYHVHNVDGDKSNNEPSNLQLLKQSDHQTLHGALLSQEQRERMRANINVKARPKACEWHRSTEGRLWHKKHAIECAKNMKKKPLQCVYCGGNFESVKSGSKFCSNVCKSAYRRMIGKDNETRICVCCGGEYSVNKYAKRLYCSTKCAGVYRHKKYIEKTCTTCVQHGS